VDGPILITGCSSGIGAAAARDLVARGHTVYATARTPVEIEGARWLALDVNDDEQARAAVAQIEAEHGSIGALVNNAGYGISGAVEAVSLDAFRRVFETNVVGYMRMAQLVLPGMRRAGQGRIVNVGSVAGRTTMPGAGPYSATKFAIRALNDALRFEARGFGIDVVLVEPGPIRTNFTGTANTSFPESEAYASFHEAIAKADAEADSSSLAGDAEDVAKAIRRAVEARRPKALYRVTFVARLLPALRGLMSERAWDAFLRSQAPAPKP